MDAHIIDIYVSSADVQQVTRIALGNVASNKVEAKSGTDKKWALTCRLGQAASDRVQKCAISVWWKSVRNWIFGIHHWLRFRHNRDLPR
jgi:hypothetical protein